MLHKNNNDASLDETVRLILEQIPSKYKSEEMSVDPQEEMFTDFESFSLNSGENISEEKINWEVIERQIEKFIFTKLPLPKNEEAMTPIHQEIAKALNENLQKIGFWHREGFFHCRKIAIQLWQLQIQALLGETYEEAQYERLDGYLILAEIYHHIYESDIQLALENYEHACNELQILLDSVFPEDNKDNFFSEDDLDLIFKLGAVQNKVGEIHMRQNQWDLSLINYEASKDTWKNYFKIRSDLKIEVPENEIEIAYLYWIDTWIRTSKIHHQQQSWQQSFDHAYQAINLTSQISCNQDQCFSVLVNACLQLAKASEQLQANNDLSSEVIFLLSDFMVDFFCGQVRMVTYAEFENIYLKLTNTSPISLDLFLKLTRMIKLTVNHDIVPKSDFKQKLQHANTIDQFVQAINSVSNYVNSNLKNTNNVQQSICLSTQFARNLQLNQQANIDVQVSHQNRPKN